MAVALPNSRSHIRSVPRVLATAGGGLALGLLAGALLAAIVATRAFGYEVLAVRSGSMEPAVGSGDLIVVRPAAIGQIEEGDIVLFAAGGDGVPTVHRVAGINEIELQVRDQSSGEVATSTERRLVTKGDANEQPDTQEVTGEQLLGEVWFSVPGAGSLTGLPLQWVLLSLTACSLAAWAAWEVKARRGTK